ncbi:MAG: ROK family transcriptional regulator [Spirochaetota bacterium]
MDKCCTIGVNEARILRALWIHRSMSRIELARYLGIDKSTVTKLTAELLGTGIIHLTEQGSSSPQGGRRPVYLAINPGFGSVLGLELQTDFYVAVAVDFSGTIIYQTRQPLTVGSESVPELCRRIYDSIQSDLESRGANLVGAVIGVSGLVNPLEGIIYLSNPLGIYEAQHLYDEFDALFDVPVILDNDANCGAWGEIAYKKDLINSDDLVFILGETRANKAQGAGYTGIAIGTSIVLGQRVHYGTRYAAGEFQSLFRSGAHMNQFSITDAEAAVYEQNSEVFSRVARELARNISFLVNMLNLNQVVLGGRMEFHPEILRIMGEEIQENWSYDTEVDVTVRFSKLQELTIAYGATGMFLETFFGLPDVQFSDSPVDKQALRNRVSRNTPFLFNYV